MPSVARYVLIVLVMIYVLLILIGRIAGTAKLGWAELSLIAFTILFASGFFERLARFSIGEKGLEFTVQDIKVRQEAQRSDLVAIKIALRGLVTKYEYNHMLQLTLDGPYNVRFGNKFFDEITRLDDIGYIHPTSSNPGGFVALRDRYSAHTEEWFNLKDYMQITDDGRAYLQARSSAL
jgi:hypothetical protein